MYMDIRILIIQIVFYINYEEFKSEGYRINKEVGTCFILTMRNLNKSIILLGVSINLVLY